MHIAELLGKLSDRSEDTLTAVVFGTLKWLPRNILAQVISGWVDADISMAQAEEAEIDFWPRLMDNNEPDLRIVVGEFMIIVEAKYGAPFSQDPGFTNHQLVQQWVQARVSAENRNLRGPYLVAVTDDAVQHVDIFPVREQLAVRAEEAGLTPNQAVQWLRWQDIATVIEEHLHELRVHERALAEDSLELMERRGVRRVFKGFDPSDYAKVVDARRTAEDKLYPAIANLADELVVRLNEDGIKWGSGNSSFISYFTTSRTAAPSGWPIPYILLPFWPERFPTPISRQGWLFVLCNLVEPEIRVGWMQSTKYLAETKEHWSPLAESFASSIRSLPEGYNAAIEWDAYARLTQVRHATEITESWVHELLRSNRQLWLYRSFDPAEVTTVEPVRHAIVEIAAAIEERPVFLDSLRAAGYLAPEATP